VLESDPHVSCDESVGRVIVRIHGVFVIVVFGLGLPIFIVRTTRRLRTKKELLASSMYAALFEW
jgi:hypothetical protein